MHIFGQKLVNSVKTTIYYGPKSPKNAFFSTIFNEKNRFPHLIPICYQKNVYSLKNLISCPYFVKKRPFSQKHSFFISFLKILHEKPPAVMPIFAQKNVNSVKTPRQKSQ